MILLRGRRRHMLSTKREAFLFASAGSAKDSTSRYTTFALPHDFPVPLRRLREDCFRFSSVSRGRTVQQGEWAPHRSPPLPPTFPASSTFARLFVFGSTIGPMVDGLHNQCLLEYQYAPINWSASLNLFQERELLFTFHSSWIVVPLLGIAYVVLGALLPRAVAWLAVQTQDRMRAANVRSTPILIEVSKKAESQSTRNRAIAAVVTTAMIVWFSAHLQTHPVSTFSSAFFGSDAADGPGHQNLLILTALALLQWFMLDGTVVSLVVAAITSFGGPLAELPFVSHGIWTYLPTASDYHPLQSVDEGLFHSALTAILGSHYHDLGIASITGPCYFAVAMDAIAIGGWFDTLAESEASGD
jgi:hypothetical protein